MIKGGLRSDIVDLFIFIFAPSSFDHKIFVYAVYARFTGASPSRWRTPHRVHVARVYVPVHTRYVNAKSDQSDGQFAQHEKTLPFV